MDVKQLLIELIKIESPFNDEARIGKFLFDKLKSMGFNVRKQIVNKKASNFNVYAYIGKPKVIFCSHMDTVPGKLDVKSDKKYVYGRGACDTKSQIAAMISAAENALASGLTNFGLLFTVQEELNLLGAKEALKILPKAELLVVGEPTSLDLVYGHNGIVVFDLIAKGKRAHGSTPEKGVNAIEKLMEDIWAIKSLRFRADKTLGKSTFNLGKINGGIADNVVPDKATATLSFRNAIPVKEMIAKIKNSIESEFDLKMSSDPVINNSGKKLAKKLGLKPKLVRYFTESAYLSKKGNIIIIGAGDGADAHSSHEKVPIQELSKLAGIYLEIIELYS